jgi:hypothetical protein
MNPEQLLEQCKAKLARYIAPGPDDPFQLEAVFDVLDLHAAKTGDRPGTIELTVHCLECEQQAMAAYGDLFSEFYDTLLQVAERCCEEMDEAPELKASYRTRIEALVSAASRVGYWYGEGLYEVFAQLSWEDEDDVESA